MPFAAGADLLFLDASLQVTLSRDAKQNEDLREHQPIHDQKSRRLASPSAQIFVHMQLCDADQIVIVLVNQVRPKSKIEMISDDHACTDLQKEAEMMMLGWRIHHSCAALLTHANYHETLPYLHHRLMCRKNIGCTILEVARACIAHLSVRLRPRR